MTADRDALMRDAKELEIHYSISLLVSLVRLDDLTRNNHWISKGLFINGHVLDNDLSIVRGCSK